MATPRRIFRVYQRLWESADEVRDFCVAKGEPVSSTLALLLAKDRAKALRRWGEEMEELCGVLDGTHHDSYLMEATQCFYWASLYAVTGGVTWETLDFDHQRRAAATCRIDTIGEVRAAAVRLAGLGVAAKPEKLFLVWNAADWCYRKQTAADKQWSLDQLMEADLQDMKKRAYLAPILRATEDG